MIEKKLSAVRIDVLFPGTLIDRTVRVLQRDRDLEEPVVAPTIDKLTLIGNLVRDAREARLRKIAETVSESIMPKIRRPVVDKLTQLQHNGHRLIGLTVAPNFVALHALDRIHHELAIDINPVRSARFRKNIIDGKPVRSYKVADEHKEIERLKQHYKVPQLDTAFIQSHLDVNWFTSPDSGNVLNTPSHVIMVKPDAELAALEIASKWEILTVNE